MKFQPTITMGTILTILAMMGSFLGMSLKAQQYFDKMTGSIEQVSASILVESNTRVDHENVTQRKLDELSLQYHQLVDILIHAPGLQTAQPAHPGH